MPKESRLAKVIRQKTRDFCELIMMFLSSGAFLKVTFAWFILQGIFFAISTRVGLPPDENYHLQFIDLFANNNFMPFVSNQAEYAQLGEVERTPFFIYHYLFSFLYLFVQDWEHSVVVLRLVNLVLGVASLVVTIKIADVLRINRAARNLSVFMLSGTLMYVFLFAAVSYDSLFILASLFSILMLLKILREPNATRALLLILALAVGSLTKITFLVIVLAIVFGLIVKFRTGYRATWDSIRQSFQSNKRFNVVLLVAVGLVLILIAHRYGHNIVKYHALAPSCTQVQSVDVCRQNPVFARDEMVFGERRLEPSKDPFEYVYDWVPLIQNRTYGILGGEELAPLKITSAWAQILVVLAVIAVARIWSKKDGLLTVAVAVALFYTLVLILEGFQTYMASGRFGFATQGRYMFAVLPILYLATNYYIFRLFPGLVVRTMYVLLSLAIFVAAGLPTYLLQSNTKWYTPEFSKVLQQMKD